MAVNGAQSEKTYAKVLITLENCILSPDKLTETPSVKDGLDKNVEEDLRIIGCEFIQTSGLLLKLPQVAMATGQVLFQRFYYTKSFVKHDVEVYAMACIFLAAKIEEAPRRIRDVINVFHYIKQKRNNRPIQPLEYMGNLYFNRKNQVVKAERRVLKELGFCVHVKHPHKIIITYLQILECETNQELAQLAWNHMNDSLRTSAFVRFAPETIACACIFLASRLLKICLPSNPPWYELFDAQLSDLEEISLTILRLFARPKVSLDSLQKKVAVLQKELEDKKKKKEGEEKDGKESPNTSPHSGSRAGSRASSPTKFSPGNEELKKKVPVSKSEDVKKNDNKERHQSRATRRSKSPKHRHRPESRSRSGSRSKSRSRSRSRGRSRSYSISISPDSHKSRSESPSSDGESPDRQRPSPHRRSRPRNRKDRQLDKKTKTLPNSYAPKRDKPRERKKVARDRSRSPRSRSRSRERTKRHYEKYGRDRNRERTRDRNGVDNKSRDREDRDHSRRYR
ncbi:cyclin-L2 [Nematostella vectensis]|uniref:cyclin-L2 n=1 Tax=Nematostella vectensis TaxID=45351 RepID=UPI002076D5EE|nr:cyclin-L2 [Nematostella vectensis]